MTVYKLRSGGSNIVVEAHGKVLFLPGGDVSRFTRKFTAATRRFVAEAAPTNKRPRWAHYGKPLKRTIHSTAPRFVVAPGGARLHAAVGSDAPHGWYVDQGTGVYGGKGPYEAKILPPWTRGSPSLYEHTFKVPENHGPPGEPDIHWEPVGTITIKGQKGQFYFDKGLRRAFLYMLRSSGQIKTNPKVGQALASIPHGLGDHFGNTPSDAAFRAQLDEWRSWRDRAWYSGRILGQGYVAERYRREFRDVKRTIDRAERAAQTKAQRAAASRLRSKAWRDQQRANRPVPVGPTEKAKVQLTPAQIQAQLTAAAAKRRREENRRVLEAQRRKDLGRKKREAAERAQREKERATAALRAGNRQSQEQAREFFRLIKSQYPDATIGSTVLPDGTVVWQVAYTDFSGERHRERWAYGYDV